MIKWRLITCNGRGNVIYPWECIEDVETELYQRHDTLQLSKMALEVATEYPNDCQTKQKIYDITCQAKVCEVCLWSTYDLISMMSVSFSLCCLLLLETTLINTRIWFERHFIFKCMLQLCSCRYTPVTWVVSNSLSCWNLWIEEDWPTSLLPTKTYSSYGWKVCCKWHSRSICSWAI